MSEPTLQELAAETLTQKNRRIRQAKCKHTDTYESVVLGPDGESRTGFCWDCGKSFNNANPALGETA